MKLLSRLRKTTLSFLLVVFFLFFVAPITHTAPFIWINKGNTSEKVVVLTIDDGSDGSNYSKILQILNEYNIKATFFLTGQGIKNHPQTIRNTASQGHEVGNHSYNHPNFTTLSKTRSRHNYDKQKRSTKNITGKSTKPYFRSPYGTVNSNILNVAGSEGYTYTFHWTIDRTGNSINTIYNRVMDHLQPGAIILMHTSYGAKRTPATLKRLIPAIKKMGYQFITISQLIKLQNKQDNSTSNKMYTVKPGDTLFSIAKKQHTTVIKIAQVNNIKNVNLIHVGQVLRIP